MSDYYHINGPELDRYITGNYGEDQYKGLIECCTCGEMVNPDCLDDDRCPECGEPLWQMQEPDPDRKYDEERERRMFGD